MDEVEKIVARTMRLEWPVDAGDVVFSFPSDLSQRDVEDISELLAITIESMRRRATHLQSQEGLSDGE